MSQTMPLLFASILMSGTVGPGTLLGFIFVLVAAAIVMLVAIGRVIVKGRMERSRCRNWPTVSAVVEIASVAYCESGSYKATLTYVYQNPEKQMGDYSRDFGKKEDAEAWANSYKGETVVVHVDPDDPTNSILREEDL